MYPWVRGIDAEGVDRRAHVVDLDGHGPGFPGLLVLAQGQLDEIIVDESFGRPIDVLKEALRAEALGGLGILPPGDPGQELQGGYGGGKTFIDRRRGDGQNKNQ
jgi:hypothetical protein